jgi:glutamate decarboxylase
MIRQISGNSRKNALHIYKKLKIKIYSLEGSRPASSLHLHATLNILGRNGIESIVTRSATLTRQMAVRISSHPTRAFQALHAPQTNIFLYRMIPRELQTKVAAKAPLTEEEDRTIGELTIRVQQRQALQGVGFVSRTKVLVHESSYSRWLDAFRVVIANPLTHWEDIEAIIANQLQISVKIEEEMRIEYPSRLDHVEMWLGWPIEL